MDALRINKTAKDQLAMLKRRTGIPHNNILCRWALCRSLAEPTPPLAIEAENDGGIDIKWDTFAGEQSSVLIALVRHRCANEGAATHDDAVNHQVRLHVHRGIGYLFGDRGLTSIDNLMEATRRGKPPAT
jgi:DNA sulfur modification protein DndE